MSRPIQTKMQVLKHHRVHKIEAQPSQGASQTRTDRPVHWLHAADVALERL